MSTRATIEAIGKEHFIGLVARHARITERHKKIAVQYAIHHMSQQRIGDEHGISKSRVAQILSIVIRKAKWQAELEAVTV